MKKHWTLPKSDRLFIYCVIQILQISALSYVTKPTPPQTLFDKNCTATGKSAAPCKILQISTLSEVTKHTTPQTVPIKNYIATGEIWREIIRLIPSTKTFVWEILMDSSKIDESQQLTMKMVISKLDHRKLIQGYGCP